MGRQRFVAPYMWGVIAIGAAILLFSLYRLPFTRLDLPFLILALLVIAVSSSVVIRIPSFPGHHSLRHIHLPHYAAVRRRSSCHAGCGRRTLRITANQPQAAHHSVQLCRHGLLGVRNGMDVAHRFGSIVDLPRAGYTGGFIGAIWVMALTQYAVNSGLVAAEKSLKREQPFWKTWRTFYLWTR